jgi:hypothetical protein
LPGGRDILGSKMPDDFRLAVGFTMHPKTLSMMQILGDRSFWCLVRLFEFCATTRGRHNGDLAGMTDPQIETAAGWLPVGKSGAFVRALSGRSAKFLDGKRFKRKIHDFETHNPWLAGASERSEAAKKAAEKRWSKRQQGMRSASSRISGSADPQCPNSNSDPVSISDPDPISKSESKKPPSVSKTETDRVVCVLNCYRKHHPKSRLGTNSKEARLIRNRLAEGYSTGDLCQAIDGCHLSEFHNGANDRGKAYQSLELIMRDSSHVSGFMEIAEKGGETPQKTPGKRTWLDVSKEIDNACERAKNAEFQSDDGEAAQFLPLPPIPR